MKPAPFRYARPESLQEALALLAAEGEAASLLAGGQSLMAMMNMRLARPELVIDINRLPGLGDIVLEGDVVSIGALVRQAALERSEPVAEHLPLLAKALPEIAHPAIRNRGTLGGSLALADPAAELPAVAVALGAELELVGPEGRRRVPAENYYRGLYETARRPDEMLLAAHFPAQAADEVSLFDEFSRRHGDFAVVGLAGRLRLVDGRFRDCRLVFFGSESHPHLAAGLAATLEGQAWDETTAMRAADAIAGDLDPIASLEGSAEFKLHLAQVLARRALSGLA
jgi:aerobic carbon-monoxide dehydrogenase medium subunit